MATWCQIRTEHLIDDIQARPVIRESIINLYVYFVSLHKVHFIQVQSIVFAQMVTT